PTGTSRAPSIARFRSVPHTTRIRRLERKTRLEALMDAVARRRRRSRSGSRLDHRTIGTWHGASRGARQADLGSAPAPPRFRSAEPTPDGRAPVAQEKGQPL